MTNDTVLDNLHKAAQDNVASLRQSITQLAEDQIDLILTGARSHYAWQDRPVSDDQMKRIFDIAKMGPTSMNTCPVRILFVKSDAGKEKLSKALKPANVPKVMGAPVTAILAYDTEFWQDLPKLFPHEDRRHFFEGKAAYIEDTAYRNSTLQGAYFMIAARAIGLDVGAISGFDNAVVDAEFFGGTSLKSNFLCNLGYADETALFQRLPRYDFDDVCKIV